MTVQITIVGLGQIGASIGLALGDQKERILRVGHDREARVAQQAEKAGAVDRIVYNLPNAVKDAAVIILALPVDQVKDTLAVIAPDLRENVIVLGAAPAQERIESWVKELLPPNRHYVGLVPALNPAYLNETTRGVEAAHADLFRDGLFAIVAPPGVPSDAIRLATELAQMMKAEHIFIDAVEVDSLMAATHFLPQVMATALLNVTVDQPGWREGRKVAGRPYALLTGQGINLDDAEALAEALLSNPQSVQRWIETIIAALQELRAELRDHNRQALLERLSAASEGRQRWWRERTAANWSVEDTAPKEMPTLDWFSRLFGVGLKPKPKQKRD
jgi:prephenate dehydrogenase